METEEGISVGDLGELLAGPAGRVCRWVPARSPRQFRQRRLAQQVGHPLSAFDDEPADGTAMPGVAGIGMYGAIAAGQMAVDVPDDFQGRDGVGRAREGESPVHAAQRFQEPGSHKRLEDLGQMFFRQSHISPDSRKRNKRLGWLAGQIRHAVNCVDAGS